MAVRESGRPAVTHYRVVERFRAHTYLSVQLETGRTHQIRLHLSHLKYPIVGDPVYGGRFAQPRGASQGLLTTLRAFKRQALHAATLGFDHPRTGKRVGLHSPGARRTSHSCCWRCAMTRVRRRNSSAHDNALVRGGLAGASGRARLVDPARRCAKRRQQGSVWVLQFGRSRRRRSGCGCRESSPVEEWRPGCPTSLLGCLRCMGLGSRTWIRLPRQVPRTPRSREDSATCARYSPLTVSPLSSRPTQEIPWPRLMRVGVGWRPG